MQKKAVQTNQPPKSKAGKNRLQEMRAAMKAKMAEQKSKMASQSTSEHKEVCDLGCSDDNVVNVSDSGVGNEW